MPLGMMPVKTVSQPKVSYYLESQIIEPPNVMMVEAGLE